MDNIVLVLIPASLIQILGVILLITLIVCSVYQINNERKRKRILDEFEEKKEQFYSK